MSHWLQVLAIGRVLIVRGSSVLRRPFRDHKDLIQNKVGLLPGNAITSSKIIVATCNNRFQKDIEIPSQPSQNDCRQGNRWPMVYQGWVIHCWWEEKLVGLAAVGISMEALQQKHYHLT